jgi:predicted RND superfamily exporter protein
MTVGDRLFALYDRSVLRRPGAALAVLLAAFACIGYWAKDFRLDASADSLVLEHDDDLRYFQDVGSRYKTEEFLVLTYSPQGDLFADAELDRLQNLRDELAGLDRVSSVLTILDVPLFRSPPIAFKDLTSRLRTLRSPDTDRAMARREFAESPVYRNLLTNPELTSTALLVNFERDAAASARYDRRIALREKRYLEAAMTAEETAELAGLEAWYRSHKDATKKARHLDIKSVRAVMDGYRAHARLFLGGVPMVVDDMITFVRRDIWVFGGGMLVFLLATLGVIFRRARWMALPVATCLVSVAVMTGLLGLARWDVTVVSSNFISLQLIMTMEYCIYVIVRYREVSRERPELDHIGVVRETVRTVFVPVLFSCATTIAGFWSLIVCDILPVVDFGWMMSIGLCVSLGVTFLLFPAAVLFLPRETDAPEKPAGRLIPDFFAGLAQDRRAWVVAAALALAAATAVGITRLEVENSFISYFKESTEIYQGLKVIDRELGGTTPLDVIVKFDPSGGPAAAAPSGGEATMSPDDDFALMEGGPAEDPGKYWFTVDKIERVEKVHDYLESLPVSGKVLSLATVVKLVRQVKDDQPLDNLDLALVFNELPESFRKILVDPYVSKEHDEARVMVRMRDSLETLRRDAFLKQTKADLVEKLGLPPDGFRLTSFMVLYNNMLQSLYRSQIRTIGLAVLLLMLMFLALFRSFKVSVIAIVPNLLSTMTVMGVMGLAGIPLDMMTITIVSVAMGIAVDNTIQYIYRFRWELPKDGDYAACLRRCHGSVGNAIFYSCLTIILGFSILAFSNFIPTILFGLLTALAMAITLASTLTLLPLLIVWLKPFGPGRTAA